MKLKKGYIDLSRAVGPELALIFILDEWMIKIEQRLRAIEEWSKPYDDAGKK